MKRFISIVMLFVLLASALSFAEQTDSDLNIAPIITKAYEMSVERLYVEWEGNAQSYQVYLDGKLAETSSVNNAIIQVKKGAHTIIVYPVGKDSQGDSTVNVAVDLGDIGGLNVGADLSALGLDAKKTTVGTPSDPLYIDYIPDPLFTASPDKLSAYTDCENRVVLSFLDRYNGNEYLLTVKNGNDVNYARFYLTTGTQDNNEFALRENSIATVILDRDYLNSQACMVPELGNQYSFSVQIRKYATNLLDNMPINTTVHESKVSAELKYTPTAAWKEAPSITYASQTADGEVTIQWDHNDYNSGCEYSIVKINKRLGIKTGEEIIASTTEKKFILTDLLNGSYCYSIVPQIGDEEGSSSDEITVEVKNDWVVAPEMKAEILGSGEIKISWPVVDGISKYHLTISKGNSESLLSYINYDYSKYSEIDFDAIGDQGEYLFTYDDGNLPQTGDRLKFELYGINISGDGTENKTATTMQTIIVE